MKKQFGIFMATSAVAWMAFAQNPSPTASPSSSASPEATTSVSPDPSDTASPSASPEATESPSPTPAATGRVVWLARCCVRIYKKEECKLNTAGTAVITQEIGPAYAFPPNDPAESFPVPVSQSCPEKTWTKKWELTGSTCHVSTWRHFKTFTRLVDIGVIDEDVCNDLENIDPDNPAQDVEQTLLENIIDKVLARESMPTGPGVP